MNTDNLLLAYDPFARDRDLSLDTRDNARIVPKCIVVDDAFDWQGDAPPDIPLEQLVIYEVHAQGLHRPPLVGGRSTPGTYLGFIEKIPHLQRLGVNAVELLPVHEYYVEDFLQERGLTNYWGYNTLGVLRARVVVRHAVARPAARWRSSRRWCGSCTARGSR